MIAQVGFHCTQNSTTSNDHPVPVESERVNEGQRQDVQLRVDQI